MENDTAELLTMILQLQTAIEYGDVDSAKKIAADLAKQRAIIEIKPKTNDSPTHDLIR